MNIFNTIVVIDFKFLKKTIIYYLFITSFFIPNLSLAQKDSIDLNGWNVFYHDNGKKSSEGYLQGGKPVGKWTNYYPTGIVKSVGNRKGDQLDSTWTFYNPLGLIEAELNYTMGVKNGSHKVFSKEGFLTSNEYFEKGLKQGVAYRYDEMGKLVEKQFYKDNQLEGISYVYSKEGLIIGLNKYQKNVIQARESINRKNRNGEKMGKWISFFPCPEPCPEPFIEHTEGRYQNGLKNGYFKTYNKKGEVVEIVKWKDDEIVNDAEELQSLDIRTEYYPNAQVKSIGAYKEGLQEGVFKFYDEEGNLSTANTYRSGIKTGEGNMDGAGLKQGDWLEYYPSSVLRSKGMYINGLRVGEWEFFHENGKTDQKGKYSKKGQPTGLWKWFYENGNIKREETFLAGVEDGEYVEYDTKGDIITKGLYSEGQKDGEWFYTMMDFQERGSYDLGQKTGLWEHKDVLTNKVIFSGEYIDGLPIGKHYYYYSNGKKKLDAKYSFGRRDGEWVRYNELGETVLKIRYKDGVEKKLDGVKIKPVDPEIIVED